VDAHEPVDGHVVRSFDMAGAPEHESSEAATAERSPAAAAPPSPAAKPARDELPPGTRVDHYKIMRVLGRGGMGHVYLARDVTLGRKVALKLVSPRLVGSERALKRMLLEARTTASLSHPHIVALHSVGEHGGAPYLALEYLEGQNLAERLRERRLSFREALRIGLAIAEALAEAHKNGVLHRDLKPANVVLASDGRLRVVDFGIAKRVRAEELGDDEPPRSRDAASMHLTEVEAANFAGTPAYMAPEQWRGEPSTDATDVWALGLILFEMCAGQSAFDLPEPSTAESRSMTVAAPIDESSETGPFDPVRERRRRVCSEAPMPRLDAAIAAPEAVVELIARCLAKPATERPRAAAVVEALSDLLASGSRVTGHEESPYRGLLAFGRRHADLFFGRDSDIASFVERVRTQPILPVVGPSGAGKSSFVQAGVLPRLSEQQSWVAITARPGSDPFRALANRLAREDSWTFLSDATGGHSSSGKSSRDVGELTARLSAAPNALALELRRIADERQTSVVLVIDQLEELFTLVPDADARARFMSAICGAADDPLDPVRIVFTVRGDFLDRLATGPEARAALSNVFVLRRPDVEALVEILEKPLGVVGCRFEDDRMAGEMIAAVGDEPACLPLLQFAAQQLWEHRDRTQRVLTRSAYRAMGGVEGALARHADGVLDGLAQGELTIARELLLRLVTPERTRRVLSRSPALADLPAEGERVLDRFVESRLVTASRSRDERDKGAMLELAHESLIQKWATLKGWLDAGEAELQFLSQAGQAAELWDRRGRHASELWSGDALRDAEGQLAACSSEVPKLVREFVAAARLHAVAVRRRRRAVAAVAMFALAAAATVSWLQKLNADRYRRNAEDARRVADQHRARSEQNGAMALVESARAAFADGQNLEARAKLRMALEQGDSIAMRSLWRYLSDDPLVWSQAVSGLANGIAVSPDGKTIAHANQDRVIYLFDVRSSAVRFVRESDQLLSVAYSPDGKQLAVGTWSGAIRVFNVRDDALDLARTIEAVTGRVGSTDGIAGLSFSHSGRWLAAATRGGRVVVWDASTGQLTRELARHSGTTVGVRFSADDREVVALSSEGALIAATVVDAVTRTVAAGGAAYALDLAPDGTQAAVGYRSGAVKLFDLATGRVLRELVGHRGWISSLAFSRRDASLAVGTRSGEIRIWSLTDTAVPPRVIAAHGDSVRGVAFVPGTKLLASTSWSRDVKLWDLSVRDWPRIAMGHIGPAYGTSFSARDESIVSGGYDRHTRLWDVTTGEQLAVLDPVANSPGEQPTFLADGRVLVPSGDERVRAWHPHTGELTNALTASAASIGLVEVAPGGKRVYTAGHDGVIRVWSIERGELLHELKGHTLPVRAMSFRKEGDVIASTSDDGTIRFWDRGGRQIDMLPLPGRSDGVSFAPDGGWLAAGCVDGRLRAIDWPSKQVTVLASSEARVYSVEVHRDGNRIAAARSDGKLWLWDRRAGRGDLFPVHADETNTVRFSHDGKLLATGSDDGTIRLWRVDGMRPHWRGVALLLDPPRLFTHRGWEGIEMEGTHGRVGVSSDLPAKLTAMLETEARIAVSTDAGRKLCTHKFDGSVVLYGADDGREQLRSTIAGVRQLAAVGAGCAARTDTGVVFIGSSTKSSALDNPTAIGPGRNADELAAAIGNHVVWLDERGAERARVTVPTGAVAVTSGDGFVALGFREGNIEIVRTDETATKAAPSPRFENVPASSPATMIAGPRGMVIVGYASGFVGMWESADGRMLARAQLHGNVTHMRLHREWLYAATDLGSHVSWDLGVAYRERCEVLRDVWQRVPFAWESGQPVLRPPPADHPCLLRR
jgi:WD40 repeat protein/serine/threonine protein kinase